VNKDPWLVWLLRFIAAFSNYFAGLWTGQTVGVQVINLQENKHSGIKEYPYING
jgi:hypothetical protein